MASRYSFHALMKTSTTIAAMMGLVSGSMHMPERSDHAGPVDSGGFDQRVGDAVDEVPGEQDGERVSAARPPEG